MGPTYDSWADKVQYLAPECLKVQDGNFQLRGVYSRVEHDESCNGYLYKAHVRSRDLIAARQ